MMMGYGPMAGFGGFWPFFGLHMLVWVALIVLAIWGIARLFPTQRGRSTDAAQEILRRRYASGEINQEEYEQAKRALG